MAKVKICGIRRIEDVKIVSRYLPEYVGFIFAESKRQVSFDRAKELIEFLDKRIKTVGIFVNENLEKVADIAQGCGLNAVQIHGDESPEYIGQLRQLLENEVEIWKAIRVKNMQSILEMKKFRTDAYVLDAHIEGCFGGAGKRFDWDLASQAHRYGKVILAGGLKPENVQEAMVKVQPFILDVSSGVETDGYKDEIKIKDFLCRVRSYE